MILTLVLFEWISSGIIIRSGNIFRYVYFLIYSAILFPVWDCVVWSIVSRQNLSEHCIAKWRQMPLLSPLLSLEFESPALTAYKLYILTTKPQSWWSISRAFPWLIICAALYIGLGGPKARITASWSRGYKEQSGYLLGNAFSLTIIMICLWIKPGLRQTKMPRLLIDHFFHMIHYASTSLTLPTARYLASHQTCIPSNFCGFRRDFSRFAQNSIPYKSNLMPSMYLNLLWLHMNPMACNVSQMHIIAGSSQLMNLSWYRNWYLPT